MSLPSLRRRLVGIPLLVIGVGAVLVYTDVIYARRLEIVAGVLTVYCRYGDSLREKTEEDNMKLLAALLITFIAVPSGAGVIGKFRAGILEGASLFRDARSALHEAVIAPAERDQALRYLRRLSSRLSILAQEKDNFAIEVRHAKWPEGGNTLVAQAHDLLAAIRSTQSALNDVFGSLPDRFRARGGTVERQLNLGLNSKLESLERIADFVESPNASREAIIAELKEDAKVTRELKTEIDTLIVEMAALPN